VINIGHNSQMCRLYFHARGPGECTCCLVQQSPHRTAEMEAHNLRRNCHWPTLIAQRNGELLIFYWYQPFPPRKLYPLSIQERQKLPKSRADHKGKSLAWSTAKIKGLIDDNFLTQNTRPKQDLAYKRPEETRLRNALLFSYFYFKLIFPSFCS
jgi:hypothetical protein